MNHNIYLIILIIGFYLICQISAQDQGLYPKPTPTITPSNHGDPSIGMKVRITYEQRMEFYRAALAYCIAAGLPLPPQPVDGP